jgi:hypothetical protein
MKPLTIAMGLALALISIAVLAQAPRGMDFRTYLSIQQGMTEGQVLGIAGAPDLQADQGVAFSGPRSGQRTALSLRTYTYLPTAADPYATTLTFVGGQLTEVRRDGKIAPANTAGARGLDFAAYLSLKPGMTEGEVLAIAGPPGAQGEEGAVLSAQGTGSAALAVRTYTYLPTDTEPHATTLTFTGGRVTEIRRDRKF